MNKPSYYNVLYHGEHGKCGWCGSPRLRKEVGKDSYMYYCPKRVRWK
jgi:hypothetical protein